MNNLTLSLGRLAVVLASTLSLGACSRADYVTNSRATSSPLTASVAVQPPTAPVQAAPYVPVAAEESAVVKAPVATTPAPVVATQPVLATPKPVAIAPSKPVAPVATAPAIATPAPKLNLVQRLALHKITKKLDKLTAQAPQFKKHDAAAARGGLDSNLRSAILFGLVGLILVILGSVANIFAILGTIAFVIGVVFLVLWLLDQA